MKKLEEFVNKETFEKLSKEEISNWKDLFEIHRKKRGEFWNDFSRTLKDSERKKLEKILYRECCWDKDKYYLSSDRNLLSDGTYKPRQKNDEMPFELIKFETIETKGNVRPIDGDDNFIKETIVIDRINRTIKKTNIFTGNREIIIETKLDYYTLNEIFHRLRIEEDSRAFGDGFEEATRYRTYKLTYANGITKEYKLWDNVEEFKNFIDKRLMLSSY